MIDLLHIIKKLNTAKWLCAVVGIALFCIVPVTGFSSLICADCCLVPGAPDGETQSGIPYKDKGGIRQYQRGESHGGAAGGFSYSQEGAQANFDHYVNSFQKYANDQTPGDCIPCLTLPEYLNGDGLPHVSGTVYGEVTYNETEQYWSWGVTSIWLHKSHECIDPAYDDDGDDIPDCEDNCPGDYNKDQEDSNNNGVGDLCDKSDKQQGEPKPCNLEQSPLVGNPVNLVNGNNIEAVTDISFNSPFSGGFAFKRYYNSQSWVKTAMGHGWNHSFNMKLYPAFSGNTAQIKILDGSGRGIYFDDFDNDGVFKGLYEENSSVILDQDTYIWTRDNGMVYRFDSVSGNLLSIIDTNSNSVALTYDSQDRLETVTDQSTGRSLTFNYNTNNQIDHITGPVTDAVLNGIWVSYTYDTDTNLISVTYADDANGSEASGFTYGYEDPHDPNNLTSKHNAAGTQLSTWTYNSFDQVIQNNTHNGRSVTINYDDPNKVQVTDIYGITAVYSITHTNGIRKVAQKSRTNGCGSCSQGIYKTEYNQAKGVPMEQEFYNGRINQYNDLDDKGNPKTTLIAQGTDQEKTIYKTYHPVLSTPLTITEKSLLADTQNPDRTKVTIYDYDDPSDPDDTDTPNETPTNLVYRIIKNGYTLDQTNSVVSYQHITTLEYNSKGQVTQVDGPVPGNEDVTLYQYDPVTSDLTSVTLPVSGTLTFEYNAAGNIIQSVDQNDIATFYTYDGRNQVTSHTTNGSTSFINYTAAGQILSQTDQTGVTTGYTYTSNGFLEKIINPLGQYIKYTYNPFGKIIEQSIYDNNDNQTLYKGYEYGDPASNLGIAPGKPWKTLNKNHENTQILESTYTYVNGNVKKIGRPDGSWTEYDYDILNRIIEQKEYRKNQDPTITRYEYDSHDNLVKVVAPNNTQTTYQYDDENLLLKEISPDSGTKTYTYTSGRLASKKTDETGFVQYLYDAQSRIRQETYDDPTQTITYAYDENPLGNGRLTSVTGPFGTYTYQYNAFGQLIEQKQTLSSVSYITGYIYDDAGRLKTITYPSGRTIEYFRTSGEITRVASNGTTLAQNIESLPFGPLKALDYGNGLTLAKTFDQNYQTDSLFISQVMDNSYQINDIGLVTSITTNQTEKIFAYEDQNRLTYAKVESGHFNYTYDSVGNRTIKTHGSQAESYNYKSGTNKLDKIIGRQGITPSSRDMEYDSFGRVKKITQNGSVLGEYSYNHLSQRISKTVNGVTTIFIYDISGSLIAESTNGTITKEYVHLGSQPLAMITDNIYLYHNDHLGTPKAMTDMSGTIVWQATHDPFGKAEVSAASTIVNNLRFPGQYYDAETGLHYNWHRYYDPSTGRYVTPDPIGLAGGINPFVYTSNNPINKIDPLGLSDMMNSYQHFHKNKGQRLPSFKPFHYNRNKYNQNVTYDVAKEQWDGSVPAYYHQQGKCNKGNRKFVSPDGHSEAIFDENNNPLSLESDPVNGPTYNYGDPRSNPIGHFFEDMLPYYMWGNTPDDPSSFWERLTGTYDDCSCQ